MMLSRSGNRNRPIGGQYNKYDNALLNLALDCRNYKIANLCNFGVMGSVIHGVWKLKVSERPIAILVAVHGLIKAKVRHERMKCFVLLKSRITFQFNSNCIVRHLAKYLNLYGTTYAEAS